MNAQTLRNMLNRQPFQPFRVVLSNGEDFEIRHPEMAYVMLNNLLVFYDVSEEGFPAQHHTLSLLHIAHLQPLDPVNPTSQEGTNNGS